MLACHVQLSSTLHAHLERREQQRSRQRAHDDEQRERDLEAQVLAHDVRLLLIASAGLRDRQQRNTSRHCDGTFTSREFTVGVWESGKWSMAPHKTLLIMSMTPEVPYHTRVPCVSRLTVPAVPRCTDLILATLRFLA
ncbi:MAG: hypothetical protein ACK559_20185, partial [bacterium]